MTRTFYIAVAIFVLLNLLAGLVRTFRGPTPADRMLTIQLFGTQGVAILLLLASALAEPALRNVALVFAVLATLAMITFVRRTPPLEPLERNRP